MPPKQGRRRFNGETHDHRKAEIAGKIKFVCPFCCSHYEFPHDEVTEEIPKCLYCKRPLVRQGSCSSPPRHEGG